MIGINTNKNATKSKFTRLQHEKADGNEKNS